MGCQKSKVATPAETMGLPAKNQKSLKNQRTATRPGPWESFLENDRKYTGHRQVYDIISSFFWFAWYITLHHKISEHPLQYTVAICSIHGLKTRGCHCWGDGLGVRDRIHSLGIWSFCHRSFGGGKNRDRSQPWWLMMVGWLGSFQDLKKNRMALASCNWFLRWIDVNWGDFLQTKNRQLKGFARPWPSNAMFAPADGSTGQRSCWRRGISTCRAHTHPVWGGGRTGRTDILPYSTHLDVKIGAYHGRQMTISIYCSSTKSKTRWGERERER